MTQEALATDLLTVKDDKWKVGCLSSKSNYE